MSNSLDPDQEQPSVGPDLDLNYLQWFISRQQKSPQARKKLKGLTAFGIPLANSVEPDLRCMLRVFFDKIIMMSKKPCKNNNKFDCSEINGKTFHNKHRQEDSIQ